MGIRASKPKPNSTPARALRGRTGEHITALVLAIVAGFLGYLRFGILPSQNVGRAVEFDYENPLLRAEPGDCVRAQSSDDPGNEMCLTVRERIERPASGPRHMAGHSNLRETLPYVALDLHTAVASPEGCSSGAPDLTLRSLNGFGLDPATQISVERIQPVWMRWSGKVDILYEVTLRRYVNEGTYVMFISPSMPVLGIVKQELVTRSGQPQKVYYREIECK